MVADALDGDMVVHVPENGLMSLNVPLDALPFYMARFDQLLRTLGLRVRRQNRYVHQTKGRMVRACADLTFLRKEARNTMSCSSPGSRRYDPDPSQREPKHCGRCVPCLIPGRHHDPESETNGRSCRHSLKIVGNQRQQFEAT